MDELNGASVAVAVGAQEAHVKGPTVIEALGMARRSIVWATVVFVVSIIVGIANPERFDPLLDVLHQLATQVWDSGFVAAAVFIFTNNLKAAVAAIVLGPALGLVPILQAAANGLLIGIVLSKAAASAGVVATLAGILPHGVFELPAMLIAWGLGLWVGMWPFLKDGLKFGERMFLAARVLFVCIIPLLAAAALIEGALISFMTH